MDEAFIPLHRLVPALLPVLPDLVDEEAGTRSYVTAYEVSTPIELDITRRDDLPGSDADPSVEIGSVPPLYHLETSLPPVLHQLRLLAVREQSEGTAS